MRNNQYEDREIWIPVLAKQVLIKAYLPETLEFFILTQFRGGAALAEHRE